MFVGGTGVAVGGTGVLVGIDGVFVRDTGVFVRDIGVFVGRPAAVVRVAVGVNVEVGVNVKVIVGPVVAVNMEVAVGASGTGVSVAWGSGVFVKANVGCVSVFWFIGRGVAVGTGVFNSLMISSAFAVVCRSRIVSSIISN